MPITIVCQCGKTLKVKEEMAGKRVKCPVCQATVTVPVVDEDETVAPIKAKAKSTSLPRADHDNEAPLPKKTKKKREQKSRTMLFVGLGAGVLLLSCCCLTTGVGVWFFFLKTPPPDQVIIGTWVVDVEATRKIDPKFSDKDANVTFEIQAGGTAITTAGSMTIVGKWKAVKVDGDTVTIEFVDPGRADVEKTRFKVLDRNHLRVLAVRSEPEIVLKRK
jgi:hypothetical protein